MLKVITPPDELISVAEAASFMRVDFPDDEEDMIESMITASRIWCEEYLRRAIGVQTIEIVLPKFPTCGKGAILLRPPVISLTSLKYLDADGTEQTLVVDTDFYISKDVEPGELRPVGSWPATLEIADAVRARFQAGYAYGSPLVSEDLPGPIRTGILLQVSDLYHNREAQVERPLSANQTLERLLSMYRLEMGI